MNRSRAIKKDRYKDDNTKRKNLVDYAKCRKIPLGMGFFKANILGGLIGFFTAAIVWIITLPIMGLVAYQNLGDLLILRTYRIGLRLTEIAEKFNWIKSLTYEQAVVIRNISYVMYAIGFLIALIVLTVLHEFTHKWVWQYGLDKETKKKEFKIGMKKLTPYCHCKIDLTIHRMIWGTIAPTITTGLLVSLIGAFTGNPFMVILGLFGVAAGGADQMQVLMLLPYLKQAKQKKVICGDLEDTFGCMLYIEN